MCHYHRYNQLTEIPGWITQWPNIDRIDFSHNNISAIPEIRSMASLTELTVTNHIIADISKVPESFHLNLKHLYIEKNPLYGDQFPEMFDDYVEAPYILFRALRRAHKMLSDIKSTLEAN